MHSDFVIRKRTPLRSRCLQVSCSQALGALYSTWDRTSVNLATELLYHMICELVNNPVSSELQTVALCVLFKFHLTPEVHPHVFLETSRISGAYPFWTVDFP
jgi:hypothetical protein